MQYRGLRHVFYSSFLFISACGGGGDGDTPTTNPGELEFTSSRYQESESAGGISFVVTRTGGADGFVSVDIIPSNGTATAVDDFNDATLTVFFDDGDSAPKNGMVNVVNDSDPESDETINLTLSNPTGGATLGATNTSVITILDNDTALLPGELQFSAATYQVGEAAGNVSITVTRTNGTLGAVSVDVATSGNTATADVDYTTTSATVNFADGDSTAQTINIPITNDPDPESSETFTVTLSNVTGGASIGTQSTSIVTILDDDNPTATGSVLNDTGVTTCSDATANGLACNDATAGTDQFPGQDAEHGRDVIDNDDGDGRAGFSFTKLDSNGVPLADQTADYATTPWDCVRDNVTGLIWEVKTNDDGLRDKDWNYSWYRSGGITAFSGPGAINGGTCVDDSNCDTEKYVTEVNVSGMCGANDWRLPSRHELFSLVDFGATATPLIDTQFFPNSISSMYWTSSESTESGGSAFIDFTGNPSGSAIRNIEMSVRLVRGGELR